MKKLLHLIAPLFALCSCSDSRPIDRSQSPEAAFQAARAALHRKDTAGYFDALTDAAVRRTLRNSISICTNWGKLKAHLASQGYGQPVGCEQILAKHGWREPVATTDIRETWDRALDNIDDPRAMAVELEALYRETGAGSSFSWSHLDPVEIKNVNMRDAATADGVVLWSNEEHRVVFLRDSTGWRFDSHPDVN